MNTHIDVESLEALAREESTANQALLEAHVAECAACADELAWLRAERVLFARGHGDESSSDALWEGVTAKLAEPVAKSAPYRVAQAPAVVASRSKRALTLVAAAAALVAITAGVAALRVRSSRVTNAHTVARPGFAERAVSGAIRLRVRTSSADVQIEPSAGARLRVTTSEDDVTPTLEQRADGQIEALFNGSAASHGRVRIELPRASSVDVGTSSGDVSIGALGGAATVRTSSGNIVVAEVESIVAESSSGDVDVHSVAGSIAVLTVSGEVRLRQQRVASTVAMVSTSGSVAWTGLCAAGCSIDARSISGDVQLGLGSASSATVTFSTTSGAYTDQFESTLVEQAPAIVRRIGAGVGGVRVWTTSGDLSLLRLR